MNRYTEAKEFSFNKLQDERALIPDAGTSVVVEFHSGSAWVTDEQSPVTVTKKIYCKGLRVRLTPDTGGFSFDDGTGI